MTRKVVVTLVLILAIAIQVMACLSVGDNVDCAKLVCKDGRVKVRTAWGCACHRPTPTPKPVFPNVLVEPSDEISKYYETRKKNLCVELFELIHDVVWDTQW